MFRKMRRFKQQITDEECINILKEEPRGVLALFGEDGYPYALPMDYIYMDGKIYFHCAKEGHKIDAIDSNDKVSFCVMNKGFKKENDWALNISSVIIFGKIKKISDPEATINIAREIGIKYYPTVDGAEEEVRKAVSRVMILELTIDHMTGKLVNES